MLIINTVITIISLQSMFNFIKRLRINNSNVRINKSALILHVALMLLSLVTATVWSLSYWDTNLTDGKLRGDMIIQDLEISITFLLQLTICLICWTMGSSSQLRKFNCIIVHNEIGQVKFVMNTKDDDELKSE